MLEVLSESNDKRNLRFGNSFSEYCGLKIEIIISDGVGVMGCPKNCVHC